MAWRENTKKGYCSKKYEHIIGGSERKKEIEGDWKK
jgi:hypothetical protein